jgi:hypothetical protein
MTRTRGEIWFFAFLLLTVAIIQLLTLRATLWPHLGIVDWLILAMLLVSPIFVLWQHLRHVREMTDEVWNTGVRFVAGGYVPLCFGFTLVERVLRG